MKICLLSSSDGRGGAYAAAYRLHTGLLNNDIESYMVVGNKITDDSTVLAGRSPFAKGWSLASHILDAVPLRFYRNRENTLYSLQWLPDTVLQRINLVKPSLVHLHWICDGFLRIESLGKMSKPIVWTLHDMWPFTGGCHYSQDCHRYTNSCGSCPQLGSTQSLDLSYCVWKRKARAWTNIPLNIVTPSRWLADCAQSSSLFRDRKITVIPNGLDTNLFKPVDKQFARSILSLPQNKMLIAFGAMGATSDKRKGYHLLEKALHSLKKRVLTDHVEFVIFGASRPAQHPDTDFKVNYLGRVNDDVTMTLVHSASDIFVAPSTQDNLPNTVMESLSCGTPCVSFRIGGMPDLIDHEQNGYLAQPYDPEDLAGGISWILENPGRLRVLSVNARQKIEKVFSLPKIANSYAELYREVLQ